MVKSRQPKRPNGDGSVYPLKNGRWKAEITVGWSADGKRLRRSRTARSRADATAFLREMQSELDRGLVRTNKTLADFLTNWLLEVDSSQERNTAVSYRLACEKHVIPLIGRTKLSDLKPATIRGMVQELKTKLAKEDKNAGGRTTENAFVVLRTALNAAVKDGELESNPCAAIKKPKHDSKEIHPFTLEESKAILQAVEPHRLYALFVLAFATGMRSGELFGLEWRDVDLSKGFLNVERQATSISGKVVVKPPKSEAGRRQIELTPKTITTLEDRRKLAMTEGWNALVFPNRRGDYIQRGVFRTRIWNPLLKKLSLSLRGFHHVRHTYACLSLGDGVPLPTVSQILGHAKQTTTLEFYSHHLPNQQRAATASMSRLFG